MIKTALTELLGITHPIVSAPMGGVSGGALAAAVTAAGGLGLVGVSYGDGEFISTHLPEAARDGGVWGAGMVMFTFDERPGLLEQVLSYAPPVVALSFGNADQTTRYVETCREGGAHVFVQVHDLEQARLAVDVGASGIIAQGSEAGGHHADRATFPFLPAVADLVGGRVPVIAAGGIGDGRGLAAALALGADGVMVGTRFAASSESLTSKGFRDQLVAATTADTMNTRAFDIVREIPWSPAYQARAIANAFTVDWHGRDEELAARAREIEPIWASAAGHDDVTQRAMFAGEVVDIVKEILPAGDIVRLIADGASEALRSLNQRVSHTS
ncbi:nitronate monooxygenase [Arthrobacter alpinus]|uniref:Nitronate monooxygenase n=1 Tax=Arthrobacter alpinus TaxID=656366 RepID=A0A1H5PGI4_9MICC|nr:nitronate monooxygenase [Arthrobacter alpinus]SEF12181.1 nitronate monooxygenase [Arthrobacter alpinus]